MGQLWRLLTPMLAVCSKPCVAGGTGLPKVVRRGLAFRSLLYAVVLVLVLAAPMRGLVWAAPKPPTITANSAVLVDVETGQILYDKHGCEPRHPASTTKLMTAILVVERGNLADLVTVSQRACSEIGSTLGLRPGDVLTLGELLRALLTISANDAATAIAEHMAGSVGEFASWMNERAIELGALDTYFVNPHGQTSPIHKSTAKDLAIIARAALADPLISEIVATRETIVTWEKPAKELKVNNTNRLLSSYEGADGVKTGTTTAAGDCLVASATREGRQLMTVVLHSDSRYSDSVRLLDFGFGSFVFLDAARRGLPLAQIGIINGQIDQLDVVPVSDLTVIMPKSDQTLSTLLELPEQLTAPIHRGDLLGRVVVLQGDHQVAETQLVAAMDCPRATFWWRIGQWWQGLW
ncbi:MAG: D-alanyl-D-alanine carboxypeptidase family protein [Bacillota bacterium]